MTDHTANTVVDGGLVIADPDYVEPPHETAVLAADAVALAWNRLNELVVLLVQRRWEPGHGLWALPGGHLDPGELDRDAAVRECREETGVQLDPSRLVEVGSWRRPGRDPRARVVSFVWTELCDQADIIDYDPDEVMNAEWLRVADVLATPQSLAIGDHHEMIRAALRVHRLNPDGTPIA